MTVAEREITEQVVWEGRIAEMGSLDTTTVPGLSVPADFLATIKASDDDPMFVVVEVEAGWSKSKRNWKPEHLRSVVEKVNKERMAGNLGHPLLDPKAYEQSFPLPQVAWCSAAMATENKAVFKGYVLKRSEARDLLRLGLIDGVSIFGDSRMKPVKGGYEVVDFTPETIDFARKGRSGMTSRVVALTGEQDPGRGDTVEPKDIAALQVEEIKTHAPLVFKAIQEEATAPLTQKIGEMEGVAATLQPEVDMLGEIKKLLKLADGDSPVEKLTALLEKIEEVGAADVRDYIKEVVSKKVKSTRGQALVMRLIGEMHTEFEDRELDDDLKGEITKAVEAKLDGDEDIKALIGEMAPFNDDDDGDRRSGGSRLGGRSRAGESRGRGDKENGIVKQNDNIVVRKQRIG